MAPQTGVPLVLLVTMVTGALGNPALRQADNLGECLDPSTGESICSFGGMCIRGKCQCPAPFTGPRCENIRPGLCVLTKACVQCSMFVSGPLAGHSCREVCSQPHPQYNVLIQSISFVDESDPDARMCQFRDDDDCIFVYTYNTTPDSDPYNEKLVIEVEREKACPR